MTDTDRGLYVSASPQGHPVDPPFTVTDADIQVVAEAILDRIAGCGFGQGLRLPPVVPGLPGRARDLLAPYVTAADSGEAYFAAQLPAGVACALYEAAPELWAGGDSSWGEPPPEDVVSCLRLCPDLELFVEMSWLRTGHWILSTAWVGGAPFDGDAEPGHVFSELDAKLRTCRVDPYVAGGRHYWMYAGGSNPGCPCSGHWDRTGGRPIDLADPVVHKHGPAWARPAGGDQGDASGAGEEVRDVDQR